MMEGPEISGSEVCEILREAIFGNLKVKLSSPAVTWNQVYSGIVPYLFDRWQISFYNDCDELDYCEAAIAPDGRSEVFLVWESSSQEPVSLLTDWERHALQQILKSVTS